MKQETKHDIAIDLAELLGQILRAPVSVMGTQELASQCGYSRSHLTRVFQELCGESLGVLHRRIRLERAAYGLRRGCSVRDASILGGFGSPEAFCRSFQRAYGQTPRAFSGGRAEWKLFSPDGLHWNEHMDETFEDRTLRLRYETQLERSPSWRLAMTQHVGNYSQLCDMWEKVPFVEDRRWMTVYLDNMWTCPSKHLMRAYLGYVLLPGEAPLPGFQLLEMPTMLTVKTKRFVERCERNEAWSYFSGVWPDSTWSWDEYEDWPLPFERVRTRACVGFVKG